jgi:hypothetical protein
MTEEIKVVVLIASHIRYDKQKEYLATAVQSLRAQTYPCDILISISFEDKYAPLFDKMIFTSHRCKMLLSDKRLYQMEHLHKLFPLCEQYDLIMFLDDDDTYSIDRVETFVNIYHQRAHSKMQIREGYSGKRFKKGQPTLDENGCYHQGKKEFWNCGITFDCFKYFWELVGDQMECLRNVYGDMLFRQFLFGNQTFLEYILIQSENRLYNYNIHSDSIIASVSRETNEKKMQQVGYLYLVTGNLAEYINLIKNGMKRFPNENQIIKLAMKLKL